MPRRGTRGHEAVALMVSRLTLCSEMREAFTGVRFGPSFERYFARKAIDDAHRGQLAELMADRESPAGADEILARASTPDLMKEINRRLHALDLKLNCKLAPRDPFSRKPLWFYVSLITALVVLLCSAWLLAIWWSGPAEAPGRTFLLSPSLTPFLLVLLLAAGFVFLWDSLTYEWL